jgi:hypothetical protein
MASLNAKLSGNASRCGASQSRWQIPPFTPESDAMSTAAEPRIIAAALQTVGSKGYDGFTIALVYRH